MRNSVQLDGQYYPRDDKGKAHKFALRDSRKGKDGEWESTFFDCVSFERTTQRIQQWFKKGDAMCVTGRLAKSEWQDKDGNSRSKMEVIVDWADFPPKDSKPKEEQQSFQPFGE